MYDRLENDKVRQIVDRVLKGDSPAFSRIIDQYKKLVAHIVYRMVYHSTDREDICQDVFIKVYQNLPDFRFEARMSTWIAKIAYHTCLNHIKRKKNLLMDDLLGTDQNWEDIDGKGTTPAELTEKHDLEVRVRQEINSLPLTHRTILTLYHLENMNYQEIGEIMNLPEGTVKSHLFRARQSLKKKLMTKYQVEELS